MVSNLTIPTFTKMVREEDAVEAVVVVRLKGLPDAVPQTGTWNHKITISQDSAIFKTGANFMPAVGA
jgi:hypothetical protein